MLKANSAEKLQSDRQSIPSDEKCLFRAIVDGLQLDLDNKTNENLRENLGKFIAECDNENLSTEKQKLQSLAVLINKMICIVYLLESNVEKVFYGDHNVLGADCIFLFNRNSRYELFFTENEENSAERKTIFKYDDVAVHEILDESISEYKLALVCETETEVLRKVYDLKETEDISSLFFENSVLKRKKRNINDMFSTTTCIEPPIETFISNDYYNQHKRIKFDENIQQPTMNFNTQFNQPTIN